MGNLANSYVMMGGNQKALESYDPLLQVQKRVLGPEDENTLTTMANIGTTYSALGRHEDALKLEEQVLEISKESPRTGAPQYCGCNGQASGLIRLHRPS